MKKKSFYQRIVLDNGLVILLTQVREVQSIFATLNIRTGAVYETKKTSGISHFVEHLVHQGTGNFPKPHQLIEAIESEGIFENGGTGRFESFYWVKAPFPKFEKALEFLRELVIYPILPKERLDHVRQVITSEYQDFWRHPENQFGQEMLQRRFKEKDFPYTLDSLGILENINRFTQEEIVCWKNTFYQPVNMVLSVAGNFKTSEATSFLKKCFGQGKKAKPISEPKFKTGGYSDFFVYNHQVERDQIQFQISFPVFGWREVKPGKRFALALFAEVFGRGPVSRLFKVLREDKGLVYSVSSQPYLFPWRGMFLISGSTQEKNLLEVVKTIKSEIEKIVKEGVLKEELVRGKNVANSLLSFKFESPESIANFFAREELSDEGIWLPERYASEYKKITLSNLNRMSKEIFDFSKVNVGLMGKVQEGTMGQIEKVFRFGYTNTRVSHFL